MADSGVHAVLVKVAAMGLKASHLGKTIGEMYPYLCELASIHDFCLWTQELWINTLLIHIE